ncbi:hypothetical protein SAMN02746065_11461 [Desulfocicer vacuolatum DSM 3385]|uniref:Uncharacterized protein n=1 Tax=Desulfocicer vacuolatum DSM 3385 TaxID=1121400 RepID=A0A1W2CYR3_9BACT|nr:hypothetical protein [Desulfocicer vacuolatum]SMC90004.1 hypothetical protein SAMN02746065_11461 [Desulfocicer vacuolatum DSM 3385]
MRAVLTSTQWIFFVIVLFFTASCADHRVASIPQTHLPPEIGTPSSKTIPAGYHHKKSRPGIVESLIRTARKELHHGQPEAAFQTLERALNIDGQDSLVWHLMAKTRSVQGQYGQAESLARKSNTLSADNASLRKKNWRLIANALEKQGRIQEASLAKQKSM